MRHSRHVLAASSAREGGQLVTSAGTPRSTSPRPRPRRRRRARRTSPRSRRSSSTGPSRPRAPPTSRAACGGTRCGRSVRPRRCTRRADASSTAPWRDPCPHVRGRWRTSRDGEAAHLGLFRRAARLGSAAAMVDAGLMCWEDGRREEAVGYYRSAADLGHPVGMCNLGVSFLEADPPKAEEAIRWFYPSASAGNARAQYNLGLCLQNGKGVKRSQKEAAKWYLRAAEGGNVRAMYNISLCYSYGEGLSQDPVRAKRWLQLAADCGHKKALYECGIKLCAAGDKVKSLMYLELATRRGEYAAAHMRDVIFESLSVVNKQRAMSDADKWKPRTLHPRR